MEVYKRQQFGGHLGFGQSPALLIVDFVNGFADPKMFGGGNIAEAIAATQYLLAAARAHGNHLASPELAARVGVHPDLKRNEDSDSVKRLPSAGAGSAGR